MLFSHSRAERDRQLEELSEAVKLTRIDAAESARQPKANGSERLTTDRTGGNADCRITSTVGGLSAETEGKSFEQR